MKKIFVLFAVALVAFASCVNSKQSMKVTVANPLALDRTGEMVEVSMSDVTDKLKLADTAQIVVLNEVGEQVPYQVTYNENVIFPVAVKANGTVTYTIQAGTPESFNAKAYGRQYPERVDDVAWENDLVAFRTYGPALQATGERAFGYDAWVKNTPELVVEARYEKELNKETKARIAELRKTDPKAAAELSRATSYHVDHGNGMDCYGVGPTLGCGTSALMDGDAIIYPYCYRTYEILDNGPLRFTVKLEYNPLVVRGDSSVIETRIITLDAGSYLNKTVVSYAGLKEAMPIATGLVLHEPDGTVSLDAASGYISYVDPTDRSADNGKIFVGAAFPSQVKDAKVVLFPEAEKKEHGGADGHVLAISDYEPGSEYTYYWGSAWSKAAIKSVNTWHTYMDEYVQKVRTPLTVTY